MKSPWLARTRVTVWGGALLALSLCSLARSLPDYAEESKSRALSEGGVGRMIDSLDAAQRAIIARGEAEFVQRWVVAPSPFGRWGRGPVSNAEACSDCHTPHGRGLSRLAGQAAPQGMVMLLGVPGESSGADLSPHPTYGGQLQTLGVLGKVPAEGIVLLDWIEHTATYADGTRALLHAPKLRLGALNFGPLGDETITSLRLAPPLAGLGLLEAISDDTLVALAEAQRARGLNGRPSLVWNALTRRDTVGRFGLKATRPDIKQQIAHAFHADLGVTSRLFPDEDCTDAQTSCKHFPRAAAVELSDAQLDAITFFVAALAPPMRDAQSVERARRGEAIFTALGCAECHVPELMTGPAAIPQLAHRRVHAFTDLLLHELGEGLADVRPEAAAAAREWRTAPLWGLGATLQNGASAALLHDGRAADAASAILWHAGEGYAAREAFRHLSATDRAAVLDFLASL